MSKRQLPPFYAYGDNQAAVEMASTIQEMETELTQLRARIAALEAKNAALEAVRQAAGEQALAISNNIESIREMHLENPNQPLTNALGQLLGIDAAIEELAAALDAAKGSDK